MSEQSVAQSEGDVKTPFPIRLADYAVQVYKTHQDEEAARKEKELREREEKDRIRAAGYLKAQLSERLGIECDPTEGRIEIEGVTFVATTGNNLFVEKVCSLCHEPFNVGIIGGIGNDAIAQVGQYLLFEGPCGSDNCPPRVAPVETLKSQDRQIKFLAEEIANTQWESPSVEWDACVKDATAILARYFDHIELRKHPSSFCSDEIADLAYLIHQACQVKSTSTVDVESLLYIFLAKKLDEVSE
jgi:hypothetical protein